MPLFEMEEICAQLKQYCVQICLYKNHLAIDIVSKLESEVKTFIYKNKLRFNTRILTKNITNESLLNYIESIFIECNDIHKNSFTEKELSQIVIKTYCPYDRPMEIENIDTDSSESMTSNHWLLPNREFVGFWENLLFESDLKEKILAYAMSILVFSDHKINDSIITCNRIILLHGPPGTGKTSLCKAVSQQLSIRTNHLYRHAHLIEINSHSLFSKWFSESGKLVINLFTKIRDFVSDENNLVCVLIDEIESLAYSRSQMCNNEPKDAIRVVNCLLTQLDNLKKYSNVIIFVTSNLSNSIDNAFLDRVDIKEFVGLPSESVIYRILDSMLLELSRVGILNDDSLNTAHSRSLIKQLSSKCQGLSGRMLRKIPFLAYSNHLCSEEVITVKNINLDHFYEVILHTLNRIQFQNNIKI